MKSTCRNRLKVGKISIRTVGTLLVNFDTGAEDPRGESLSRFENPDILCEVPLAKA